MKSLDDIFGEYEEKKAAEARAAEEKQERERAERVASGQLLGSVILPVAQKFVAEINEKGHKAELLDYTMGGQAYPHIILKFTPVPKTSARHYSGYVGASKLTFMHRDGGVVNVSIEISTARSGSAWDGYSGSRNGTDFKPEQITEEWATKQVLMFVEAALRVN
ncbi:hypothetical protein [Burkholderia sp. Ac-20353]|uniref:hypothetical protein n=1 Tax=Burkholderia sp. Ac-20353 TaxID=2703894 RepID=UPI00197C14C9|nr:hypothetical protein [Burkholderia sp. Ac-20353]MBN3791560.1 hypothetical protein [Burkholderia sp. Ac-20353]